MSTTNQRPLFCGDQPCGNCPYRTDAPLQLWALVEFENLLEKDRDLVGAVFRCHKNDGSVCKGWLMNQEQRERPSMALRVNLAKLRVPEAYLSGLNSPAPLFESIEAMIEANYPEFKMPLRPLTRMDVIEAQIDGELVRGQIMIPPMPDHPEKVEIGVVGPRGSSLRGKMIWITQQEITRNYGFIDTELVDFAEDS